ncbi:MAG: serine hydrolase, partial [Bacteroidota bacterium]
MKKLVLPLACSLLFLCPVKAQKEIPSSTLARIDALFKNVNATTPGYMVGILEDTTFILEKGYGLANLEYEVPISKNSAFNVASLSKQFTGACIALLILEGKVSLEDQITKYVPKFPKYGQKIKIKHLIYMTSGINDYYYNPRDNGTDWNSLNFFNTD